MTFNFVEENFHIGQASPDLSPQFIFYKKGFRIGNGGGIDYKDIILSGNTALTLANAKANGLNYLKLFGGTEQISGTYLDSVTLSGGTEQNGTPTPETPIDIVCNNGALKVNRNLYSTEYHDKTLSQTDGVTVSNGQDVNVSGMVDCRTIKSFKITTISPLGSFRIFKYRADNTFISASSTASFGDIVTFEDNVGFFRIQYNYTAVGTENILIYNSAHNLGIYTDGTVEQVTDSLGNTANAERLLAIGNYKDTQEVLTGTVSRNVGIKVLDGTETWTRYGQITGGYLFSTDNTITDNKLGEAYTDLYCTHAVPGQIGSWALNICRFAINSETGEVTGHKLYFSTSEATTVDGFKTWLAQQCANGTPVIIAYPLATATTESVSGQSLRKSPVEQTSGSISNLPIATTESVHTTPTPQQPLPINCNNGVVKVSKNLFDYSAVTETGKYINDSGVVKSDTYSAYWLNIPVKPSTTYTCSGIANFGGSIRLHGYTINGTWDRMIDKVTATGSVDTTFTFTTNANEYFIGISGYYTQFENCQIEQGSTATTYHPYGIYTDGTVETVNVHGNNLLDTTNIAIGFRLNIPIGSTYNSGNDFFLAPDYYVSNLIPVEVGKTYIKNSPEADAYHRFKVYDANKVSVRVSSENSVTIQSGEAYIAFCGLQTELTTAYCGETLGTATAENLFKVGSYQDVQEVLAGNVTRNVGIKVLDGTENWQFATGSQFFYVDISNLNALESTHTCYCTHFQGKSTNEPLTSGTNQCKVGWNVSTSKVWNRIYISPDISLYADVNAIKQFLADQYNAGTPVIIVYPLATATTETVAGQPLTTQAGTNIVEITQASIDNLGLEVSYKATV